MFYAVSHHYLYFRFLILILVCIGCSHQPIPESTTADSTHEIAVREAESQADQRSEPVVEDSRTEVAAADQSASTTVTDQAADSQPLTQTTVGDTTPENAVSAEAVPNQEEDINVPAAQPGLAEKQTAEKKMSDIDRDMIQAIMTANLTSGTRFSAFVDGLKNIADQLPEVVVTTGDEEFRWQRLDVLNVSSPFVPGNHRLSAFKFRSPLQTAADLHWSFVVPDDLCEWYILPVKGEMKGFDSFHFLRTMTVPQVPLELGSLFVFQELMQGQILPGEEYIIWIKPPDDAKNELWAGIRLTEVDTQSGSTSAEEICRSLGLDPKNVSFTPDEDGLRKAFEAAAKMANSQPNDLAGVNLVLRSVWDQLDVIEVDHGTKVPVWNQIHPKTNPRFHAVRFKSANTEPANLNWCYVVEKNLMRWGFLEEQNDLEHERACGLELNCPIPGIQNPEKNMVIFQKLSGGVILPESEYAIWFAQKKEQPLNRFELAASITPVLDGVDDEVATALLNRDTRPAPSYADPRQIGEAIGLSIPAVPSEERVNAAFDLCRKMVDRGERSRDFSRLIQFTLPALTELPTDGESIKWHEIRLNENGRRMAAFRLNHEGMTSGRMVMALTRPAETITQGDLPRNFRTDDSYDQRPANASILTWGIIDDFWPGVFMQHRMTQKDIADLQLGFPPKQAIDVDLYEDWQFGDDLPIIVVFSPPDDKPVTLNFAVRFEEQPKSNTTRSIKSAIEYMGLHGKTPGNEGEILNEHDFDVGFVQFVFTNDAVVSADSRGSLKWWVNVPDVEVPELKEKLPGAVCAISDDRKRLATLDYDGRQVHIIHPGSLQEITRFDLPSDRIPRQYMFSHDGQFLLGCYGRAVSEVELNASPRSMLYKWNIDDPEHPLTREYDKDQPVDSAHWMTDGRIITVGHRRVELGNKKTQSAILNGGGSAKFPLPDGQIEFLDDSTFETRSTFKIEGCGWIAVDGSGDEKRFATLARSGWVTVWDVEPVKEIASFPVSIDANGISLSNDGSRLAVISLDGEIQICDVESRRFLGCGTGRIPQARVVCISPDGKAIVTGGRDGKVRRYQILDTRPNEGLPLVMTNSIGMKLNWIPSGTYLMGQSDRLPHVPERPIQENEKHELPRHNVNLTRPFYMGRYEVTVADFRQFVEATNYVTTAEKSGRGGVHVIPQSFEFKEDVQWNWKSPGFPQKDDHPVVQVSHDDAVAFCNWLSKKEGVTYRLPTEAEWEYCCRAGCPYSYYFAYGNWMFRCANVADGELIKAYGGFPGAFNDSDGNAFTASVGSYVPNGFALYDMHGNVWEWCSDFYDPEYYGRSPANDPQGNTDGANRVQRGGGFMFGGITSESRDYGPPDQAQSHLGFRIVHEIP